MGELRVFQLISMLTSEDHRQLARRCISLAKECTKASVAEHLLMLAADYLDQAELSLIASAKTAKALNINVPLSLLERADRVME